MPNMVNAELYAYTAADNILGDASLMPFLPVTLASEGHTLDTSGLLDTGSSVNVLPYSMGIQLGAIWESQPILTELGGNLARFEARGLITQMQVGKFDPVRMVFAWTKADDIPLILGQVNFFIEFDVCFRRSRLEFEIKSKS